MNNKLKTTNLEHLTKNELLNIIGKMKKIDLINIINSKTGGGTNSVRTPITFKKNTNKPLNTMSNNKKYNNMYISNEEYSKLTKNSNNNNNNNYI